MKYTVEIEVNAQEQAWLEKAAEIRSMTAGALVQAIAENCCKVFLEQAVERTRRKAESNKPAPMESSAAQPFTPIRWPKYGKAVRE